MNARQRTFVAAAFVTFTALATWAGSIAGLTTAAVNYPGVLFDATVGPDGNAWFTDNTNDLVGRIDADGKITTFALPKGTAPTYITAGADGNLWFSALHSYGRMSTVGFFTNFPTTAYPGRIAAGPDGAVWFLDRVFSKINRVAGDGTLSTFDLGGDAMLDLIAAHDGNLWLADFTSNAIAKFSPVTNAVVAKYPLLSKGYAGDRLVLGPDGNLWFTHGDAIDRITLDGTLSEFPVASGSFPFSMTLGGDGNLWFGEYSSQRLGQVVIPKGGGTPVINESDPIGYAPGLIVAVPTRAKPVGKRGAPNDACSGSCTAPTFVVGVDKGSTSPAGNVISATAAAPNTCADLSITLRNFSYSQYDEASGAYFGRRKLLGVNVTNAGPDAAESVTVKVGLVEDWISASRGSFDTATTSDGMATFTAALIPCGATFIGNVNFISGEGSVQGTSITYATTPDPDPANNYSFVGISSPPRGATLAATDFVAVNAPVQRGH